MTGLELQTSGSITYTIEVVLFTLLLCAYLGYSIHIHPHSFQFILAI